MRLRGKRGTLSAAFWTAPIADASTMTMAPLWSQTHCQGSTCRSDGRESTAQHWIRLQGAVAADDG